jgi:N-acylneuraminate cytidylyltransferase
VVAHAAQWAIDHGWPIEAVCCISATAPFLQPDDLRRGLEKLKSGDWDYVIAATEYASPVFRAFRENRDGGIEMLFPEHFLTRSQDLPRALHDAAQFYWGRPQAWIERRRGLDLRSTTVFIPRWRVQDIDTEDDWKRAEILAPQIYRELGRELS